MIIIFNELNGNQSQSNQDLFHETDTSNNLKVLDGSALLPHEAETRTKESYSASATVMGMAAGYDFSVYQGFVGSLRMSGYEGHIILGVDENIDIKSKLYLLSRDVTLKYINWVPCTSRTPNKENDEKDIFEENDCAYPYEDMKVTWSRFPLQRDWLIECETCTGPVLLSDVRDVYFQRNPFAEGTPVIEGLQVFEEQYEVTTQHWLVEWPVRECKGITFEKPMLCSGTTIGTREATLQYLEIIYREMKEWILEVKCRFNIVGDDQSIHNYLFYTNQLPFAKAIPYRTGLVNTVGIDGSNIQEAHNNQLSEDGTLSIPVKFSGASGNDWLGSVDFLTYNLTNSDGLFVNDDGSITPVVHQYDRFGPILESWLQSQPFMQDILY